MLIAFPLQQWLRERASMLRYAALPVLLYTEKQRMHFGEMSFITYC